MTEIRELTESESQAQIPKQTILDVWPNERTDCSQNQNDILKRKGVLYIVVLRETTVAQ